MLAKKQYLLKNNTGMVKKGKIGNSKISISLHASIKKYLKHKSSNKFCEINSQPYVNRIVLKYFIHIAIVSISTYWQNYIPRIIFVV